MTDSLLIPIIMTIVGAATPILLAALGELVVEKSGVLNLGLEGMMLIGAVTGFAVTATTGYAPLGVVAAMIAAAASAGLFGFLTLTLTANQVATGLALTIFGIGLSALAGENYVGQTVHVFGSMFPAALSEHPVLRVIFGYSPLVYVSLLLVAAVSWFLRKSRGGLILRAVGESDLSAHSIGYSVIGVRYMGAVRGRHGRYCRLLLFAGADADVG